MSEMGLVIGLCFGPVMGLAVDYVLGMCWAAAWVWDETAVERTLGRFETWL